MPNSSRSLFRVSSHSDVHRLAGAIAHIIRSDGAVDLQAIGAAATNQSVKAIAVAQSFLAPEGMRITSQPQMVDLEENGMQRTAVRFAVMTG